MLSFLAFSYLPTRRPESGVAEMRGFSLRCDDLLACSVLLHSALFRRNMGPCVREWMRRCRFCCSNRRSRFPGLHSSAAACIYTHSHLPHIRSDVIFASEANSAKQSKRLAHLATWTSIGYGSFIPHLFACIFFTWFHPEAAAKPKRAAKEASQMQPWLLEPYSVS